MLTSKKLNEWNRKQKWYQYPKKDYKQTLGGHSLRLWKKGKKEITELHDSLNNLGDKKKRYGKEVEKKRFFICRFKFSGFVHWVKS